MMTADTKPQPRGRSRGFHDTFWKATAIPAPECPPLRSREVADDVVVGAGFTGVSAALRLAELGRDVVLLESDELGWGASGCTSGWWIANYQFLTPAGARERFGAAAGARMCNLMVDAGRLPPLLAEKYSIDCDVHRTGFIYAARDSKALTELNGIAAGWREFGADVRELDRRQIRDHIASDLYCGGILYHDSGRLQPLSLVRGLALAAQRAGVTVHTHSPATDIRREGSQWRVETPGGSVLAKRVVLATNAFRHDLFGLRRHFLTIKIGMIVSEPFADGGRAYTPRGIPFTDMNTGDAFAPAFGAENRLITSMLPNFIGSDEPQYVGDAFWRVFRRVFPFAPPSVRWDYGWHGHICIPSDRLVKVAEIEPGVIAVFGYSGAGIAQSLQVGQETAEWIASGDRSKLRLAPLMPKRIHLPGAFSALINRAVLPAAGAYWYR